MKITKVGVFVEVDNDFKMRQVFIKEHYSKVLISMIEAGYFHDKDVLISETPLESIIFKAKQDVSSTTSSSN